MLHLTNNVVEMTLGGILLATGIFTIIRAHYTGTWKEKSSTAKLMSLLIAIIGFFYATVGWLKFIGHNVAASMTRGISIITLGIFFIVLSKSLPTDERKRYLVLMISGIGMIILGLLGIAFEIAELLGYETP